MCCYSPTYSKVSAPTSRALFHATKLHVGRDAQVHQRTIRASDGRGHATVRAAWHTRRPEPVLAQVRASQQQAPACGDVRRVEAVDVSNVLRRQQLVRLGDVAGYAEMRVSMAGRCDSGHARRIIPTRRRGLRGIWGIPAEVDIEYPKEIHDAHADLPFCLVRKHAPRGKQTKLLATLDDKERYVIHYRYLKQCIRHGLRVTRIHRVLRFDQSHWLRDYIQLNTGLKTRATSEFQKTLFKLMNNAVYGKTMENVRNRVDVRLVTQ